MSQYQIVPIWWPDGWEPQGPLDVPKCLAAAPADLKAIPIMPYDQALATLRGLNRQNIDHPGTMWHVLADSEASQSSSLDAELVEVPSPNGPVQATRILRSVEGGGRGDCSHCPAHHMPCGSDS